MRRSRPALLLLPRDPASCWKAKGQKWQNGDSRGWGIPAVSPPQDTQEVTSMPWLAAVLMQGFIHQDISCIQALEGQLEGWECLGGYTRGAPVGKEVLKAGQS